MMTDGILTDVQIAALTPAERRELIIRLQAPLREVIDPVLLNRIRRARLSLMIGCSIAMIPWLVYLSLTLPENYVAHNWPATWVGFDILLVAFMVATAVLGYLRRQLLLFTAFTSGVLLICDAWFDLMTAGPNDLWLSVVTAFGIELPLAIFMITGAQRIMRLTMMRLWKLDPGCGCGSCRCFRKSVQAWVGEFVDQRGQLIDELVGLKSDVTGQPCADGLRDTAHREVRPRFDAVVCRHPQRRPGMLAGQHGEQRC